MTDEPWWHNNDEVPPDPVGSAAEEAGRLFTAVRDRLMSDPTALRAGARLLDTFATLQGHTGSLPGESSECAYCPFCQAMARAKSLSPEHVERLTAAAVEFADTVRTIVGTPDQPDDDRVRHVPLDEDFEDWPEPGEAGAAVDESVDVRAESDEEQETDAPNQ